MGDLFDGGGGGRADGGDGGDGLGEAAYEGGEGESGAAELCGAVAAADEREVGLEQGVIEGLFGLVRGEAAEAAGRGEESALGLHAVGGVGWAGGLPESDHGAEVGGIGCGASGE